jgi:hypothetical protein
MNEEEARQQQGQLSLSQALLLFHQAGSSSMPTQQPCAGMSRDEQRALILSTLEAALTIMSADDDESIFIPSVSSASNNDDDNDVQTNQ